MAKFACLQAACWLEILQAKPPRIPKLPTDWAEQRKLLGFQEA
jgi:hypothetical protein